MSIISIKHEHNYDLYTNLCDYCGVNKYAQQLGRLGGLATKRKYGAKYYKKLSKIMVEAKRAKKQVHKTAKS